MLLVHPLRAALAAGPSVPSAGAILQQIQAGQAAGAASAAPSLTVQEKPVATVPPSIAFRVTTIKITGNTRFSTDELHALVQDAEGQDLTLAALSAVVARITEHYQRQGFPLARAIVPGQTLVDGVLQVQVIEARYDAVTLVNQSPLNDALLRSALSGIQSGHVIQQAPLDHALLSLSDIPGVLVQATMKPGSRPGATDLVVRTAASAQLSGSTVVDNYGNGYVGRTRVGQTLRLMDPFNQQMGATLDLSGLSSGHGLNYGRVAYETVCSGAVSRVGGSYSALQYVLGGPLAASGARGDAQLAQVWARHSILRSYTANLYAQIQYDNTLLRDHAGIDIGSDRRIDKINASLSGDVRDGLGLGAVNHWNLSLSNGAVTFDSAAAQLSNAGQTEGGFSKLGAHFSRLQKLSSTGSLYAALTLQWASRNLDPSEKMAIGGASTVRSADASALSGDTGALLNLEYRHNLGAAWGGNWQLSAFMDSASVQLNKTALGASENLAQVGGAGVGLAWSGMYPFYVKAQLSRSMGAPASLVGVSDSVRGWVEITHTF